MKHFWVDKVDTNISRSMATYGYRKCKNCGVEQHKYSNQSWGRVTGYSWYPLVGRCKGLFAYEVGVTTGHGTKTVGAFNTQSEAENRAKEYRMKNPETKYIWVDRWHSNPENDHYEIDDTFEEIHF